MSTRAEWSPETWRAYTAAQQPEWPDAGALERARAELRAYPPLVFAGEARALRHALANVVEGRGFLLQAGDCAESFAAFSAPMIREQLKVILQMAVVLTYSAGVPVVKVGRVAGQFAKPRSADIEDRDGKALPSYRGDLVNDIAFDGVARVADPARMITGYHHATATLNLVRAFTKGGFADLRRVHQWTQEFVASSAEGRRYERVATEIERALLFMQACGVDLERNPSFQETEFFASHEALILEYEAALTRVDSTTGDWYDCSAHMVWIGERTRQLDGAHVAFCAGIHNPIGVKLGPSVAPEEVVALCERLNPERVPGRLTLVSRMGAERVEAGLAPLLAAVHAAGHPVVWVCDPMHGNTFVHSSGYKTRRFDDVMREIKGFFATCHNAGVWPGGVHVELTGENVTECLGGVEAIGDDDLETRYETVCDPRLNARQSLDLAFEVAELMRG
ncbi:MAG: class II 3-deoxy-7-phosphoheptulonate synthase [Acidimicrobiia bacterium]